MNPGSPLPGNFLFGGCALGWRTGCPRRGVGPPTVWATAQYLSYAPTHSQVDWEVTLAVVGGRVTQGRAVGRVGDREILTVNAALGSDQGALNGIWVEPPVVPPPEECPNRFLPSMFRNTIFDKVDVRVAKGLPFDKMNGEPGDPDSALWARVPGHLTPSAATLAIFGDYVTGSASQALGRRSMGRSLDNTLRVAQLKPTEWVLCDIRIHAVINGYAQGVAFLWTKEGEFLARPASRSSSGCGRAMTSRRNDPVDHPTGAWLQFAGSRHRRNPIDPLAG